MYAWQNCAIFPNQENCRYTDRQFQLIATDQERTQWQTKLCNSQTLFATKHFLSSQDCLIHYHNNIQLQKRARQVFPTTSATHFRPDLLLTYQEVHDDLTSANGPIALSTFHNVLKDLMNRCSSWFTIYSYTLLGCSTGPWDKCLECLPANFA